MKSGSLFTGTGALDRAAAEVFGAEPAWVADLDLGASALLAHHYPDLPNLRDITAVDWDLVALLAPVDLITAAARALAAAGLLADPVQKAELERERDTWEAEYERVRDLKLTDLADALADRDALKYEAGQAAIRNRTLQARVDELIVQFHDMRKVAMERQRRIDEARHHLTRKDKPAGVCVEAAVAALQADQPLSPSPVDSGEAPAKDGA